MYKACIRTFMDYFVQVQTDPEHLVGYKKNIQHF